MNELSFLGMAFTVDGNRLGRGKGYYDTYLSKAKTKNICPITVALAFEQQILKSETVRCEERTVNQTNKPKQPKQQTK